MPVILSVPCAGFVTRLYIKVSPSASVALSVISFAVSSLVVVLASLAMGAVLVTFTFMYTVAVFESTVPSFTL